MASSDLVRQAVSQAPVAAGTKPGIAQAFAKQKTEIERALPNGIDADRFLRIALTCVRVNPKLAECDQDSVLGSLMQAAQLGCEPGNGLGLSYLVPRGGECQFQLGYKGIIDLARRSGLLLDIQAREVRENDHFEYAYGLEDRLEHKPALTERGKVICYYGIAKFTNGGHYFIVVDLEEIERHRKRSQTANSSFSPWKTDYEAMARKTVIRMMAPYLPLSPEIRRAIASDGAVPSKDERGKVILDANMAERGAIVGDADYLDADIVPPREIPAAQPEPAQPAAAAREPFPDEPPDARGGGTPGGDPVRGGGEAGSIPATATPTPATSEEPTAGPQGDGAQQTDEPLPKSVQARRVKELLTVAAKVPELDDAILMALIRNFSNGAKALPSDLTSELDFYKAHSAVREFADGQWTVDPDGTVTLTSAAGR